MSRYPREISVSSALGILLLGLAFFAPSFYQPRPLLSFLAGEAPALVAACGVALVLIARQIDISIGAQFAVCSVCAGLLAGLHWAVGLVLIASVALGALLGAINGVFVALLQLPSIVVTLATMAAWREGLRWQRQGAFVNLPPGLQWFGMNQTLGQLVLVATAVILLTLLALASRRLAAGRMIYAVGSDAEAARLAGIRPRLVTFFVFVGMGALAGLAALLNMVQSPQVDPKTGTGLELRTIASAVVGGIAISGGRGNLWGVLAGFLLLACVTPALIHLHIEAYWERAIAGAIILAAVLGEGLSTKQKTQSRTAHQLSPEKT